MFLNEYTGRGVRIAVVDSGVHAADPHVGGVDEGIAIRPMRAIQDLAGHRDLGTTQRYMHLSPAAIQSAIRLLDERGTVSGIGDMLETAQSSAENVRNA